MHAAMHRPAKGRSPAAQRGISLVFALVGLLVLSLGAVALVRSVDTSVLAMGNLAMKQAALAANSHGADDAVRWMRAQLDTRATALDADMPAQGYYAVSHDALDPSARSAGTAAVLTLVDWQANGCQVNGSSAGASACLQPSPPRTLNGFTVRYVITRLCNAPGDPNQAGSLVNCAMPPAPSEAGGGSFMGGGRGYATDRHAGSQSHNPYYRVITHAINAKGTVSLTETLAHF